MYCYITIILCHRFQNIILFNYIKLYYMSINFNVGHISYRFYCDKLSSIDLSKNLIIESSANNIEFKSNNRNISFNNSTIFNSGLNMNDKDLSNIHTIRGNVLNIDTLFLRDISNSLANIVDDNFIEDGYIRGTTIGYNPVEPNIISARDGYFTYIDVSGGDSSFNNSVYIKNSLGVSGTTTISNDLIVNGTSYVTLYNAINNYITNIRQDLSSAKIVTNDLSASNISISNDLVVAKTSFINDLSISGHLIDNILKVPHDFTIDPSGHDNASGTLIINGDLIVYGNRTTIASSIVEISDITLSVATNLTISNDLYRNEAGLDISNVASIKYDGRDWNFNGGQLSVENKKVSLDVSLIALKNSVGASLNILNSSFDLSYSQLKNNNDNSFNVTYTKSQIDASFILKSIHDVSLDNFKFYVDNSFVSALTVDASFSALKTYLDASYIPKGTIINPNIIDSSLTFLRNKLDLSFVLKRVFDASYNDLKSQIDASFASVRLTSLDTPSISIDTINTKHSSGQTFNNTLWNQLGLDISNGPPLTNNNNKIAISNDGKVVAMASSSHSDISKGRVYVYELSYNQISYNFTRLGLSSEIIVGLSNNDEFGWDIALSSNGRVVAGSSILNDASGTNSGQVRLFELSNNNRWFQKGSPINGPRANSESGYSISLAGNGNSIAIGAWKDNSNGTNAGAVRVYDFSASINDWRQKGQTIAGISGSNEGYSTALSLDGLTLASGNPSYNTSTNTSTTITNTATGGTITTSGSYRIHSFTTVGSDTFTPSFSGSVEVLIVGGGGGGGPNLGGGGGGGAVIWIPATNVSANTNYSIDVGNGGASGTNGQNSSAFGALAAGGGTSGSWPSGSGTAGGSGGGAAANDGTINQGGGVSNVSTLGTNSGFIYGNRGGNMTNSRTADPTRAAGGGGAGGQGLDTNSNTTGDTGQTGMGSGGVGVVNAILGPIYYWGGGGGGGAWSSQFGGWGGLGGGGGGSGRNGRGTGGGSALTSGEYGGNGGNTYGGAGGTNTGGGGGGGNHPSGLGGAGGSGIVVIRYLQQVTINTTIVNLNVGLVKIFSWSGTTWAPKGTIQGPDISNSYFGRSIKLSANGNTIVIGAPGYTNEYRIPPVYEYNSTAMNWQSHRDNAITVYGRDLAVILDASQNARANALRNNTNAYIGGRRRSSSSTPSGKTSADWEWVTGDVWNYQNFSSGEPNTLDEKAAHFWTSDGKWNDINSASNYPAIYMYYKARVLSIGQVYAYGYVGGTTWSQLGQAIQGISGGNEFGSSVAISNDGTIISVGTNDISSNRGYVNVYKYVNNYWRQISNTLNGKVLSFKAGIHALSGDGTTLFQSNNNYYSVYGINKLLALNSPITSISGNLIVIGATSVNSLDISRNHSYSTNGYSYKVFESSLATAIMKEYYSDVTSLRHLKVQILGNGNITNRNNSYSSLSDSRLKENIVSTSPKLEDLLKVRVVNYNLKGSDNSTYIGVLAQELEELFPNLVTELEPSPKDIQDGNTIKYKTVNYSCFDSLLIKSLQEQNAMLKNIEKRIIALEDE